MSADPRILALIERMSRIQDGIKNRNVELSQDQLNNMLNLTDELNDSITQLENIQKKINGEENGLD